MIIIKKIDSVKKIISLFTFFSLKIPNNKKIKDSTNKGYLIDAFIVS